jgi:FkbM family methyltransferase
VDKVKFDNRKHVESIGLDGAGFEETEEFYICNTLSSYKICADKSDLGYTKHAKSDGYWESWITYWISKNVDPGSKVADIGANHGYYSLMLASIGCSVDSYEPQPRLCYLISKSCELSSLSNLVSIQNVAISDNIGKANFVVPVGHGMNAAIENSAYRPYTPINEYIEYEVDTITLDSLSDKQYDFIKIDAEGGEEKIWAGMQNFIKDSAKTVILLEWNYKRYISPVEFANNIFKDFDVKRVDFNGEENLCSVSELLEEKENDLMLVIRNKNR